MYFTHGGMPRCAHKDGKTLCTCQHSPSPDGPHSDLAKERNLILLKLMVPAATVPIVLVHKVPNRSPNFPRPLCLLLVAPVSTILLCAVNHHVHKDVFSEPELDIHVDTTALNSFLTKKNKLIAEPKTPNDSQTWCARWCDMVRGGAEAIIKGQ